MKANIYTQEGNEKGTVTLPEEVFAAEINETLMHSVVTMYLANQRQGTSKTKTRSEVSGSGKKPFRQKGTGRARAGSNKSPVWVRGGKAFGPVPRNYNSTIPKKMKRAALCSALSSRAKNENIIIVDKVTMEQPKTKNIAELLEKLSIYHKKNLLIIDNGDRDIFLSGRNIKNVDVKAVNDINTYDVLNNETVVFSNEHLIEKVRQVVKR